MRRRRARPTPTTRAGSALLPTVLALGAVAAMGPLLPVQPRPEPAAARPAAAVPEPPRLAGVGPPIGVDPPEPVAPEPVAPVPAPEVPAPPEPPSPDPCAEALAWVADAGLPLPAGVDYHCPSTQFPHHGAACWDWGPCAGGAFVAVNLARMAGSRTEYLRYVVAHEVCHILDFQRTGTTTEAGADACAAAHGAPA